MEEESTDFLYLSSSFTVFHPQPQTIIAANIEEEVNAHAAETTTSEQQPPRY